MSIRLGCAALVVAAALGSPARAALSFSYTYFDNSAGDFALRGWLDPNSLFQRNIRAAADLWGAQFASNATIVVHVDPTSYSVCAGGSGTLGRFLYTNPQGAAVYEQGVLSRILTGDNPGEDAYGYDIVLGFDAAYLDGHYWLDPQPDLRTAAVPPSRGDFISVVMHEMGHGLGLTGFRDATGTAPLPVATVVDEMSYFGGNGNPFAPSGAPNPMFFSGDLAAAAHGSDLALTHKPVGDFLYSQNFYHLSACNPAAPDGLEGTLMNGCELPTGDRLYITAVDRAVMGDLGFPLAPSADFTHDGSVNGLDLTTWKMAFGVTPAADADGDGDSDGADFLAWQRQRGTGLAAHVVPEPPAHGQASWLLAAIAVAAFNTRRARA